MPVALVPPPGTGVALAGGRLAPVAIPVTLSVSPFGSLSLTSTPLAPALTLAVPSLMLLVSSVATGGLLAPLMMIVICAVALPP